MTTSRSQPASTAASPSLPRTTSIPCWGRLGTLASAATEAIIEEQERTEAPIAEPGTIWPASASFRPSADDAPVIKLVYSILGQAVGEGASDIHLEPEESEMRIRFRVDGVLREAAHVPKRMIGAVISRIKIMSEMDIAEKRIPQDGRASVSVEERRVDLRVTTLPTQRGEGATIRILDTENAQLTLDALGSRVPPASASNPPSSGPTASSSSPARPARASRRRSTRRSRT